MTFADACAYIASNIAPDGDNPFGALPTTNFIASKFGQRVASLLGEFSRATYLLYSLPEPITLAPGDREFNFADPANCAKSFFHVLDVWIDNVKIRRCEYSDIRSRFYPNDPQNIPSKFAQLDSYRIVFDYACGAAYPNSFAEGWYRHPPITSDSQVLQNMDDYLILFDHWCQANIREVVVSDEIGMQRLQRFDSASYSAAMDLRGQSLARILSGSRNQTYGY